MKKTIRTTTGTMVTDGATRVESMIAALGDPNMVSIKMKCAGYGVRDQSERAMFAAAMDRIGSNPLNGNITFKFTKEFAEEHEAEIVSCIEMLHRHTNNLLNEVNKVQNLGDEHGKKIMIQRAILKGAAQVFSNRGSALSNEDIKQAMIELQLFDLSRQQVLESTIIMGSTADILPEHASEENNNLGYRPCEIQMSTGTVTGYKKVCEVYGQKRVPLTNQQAVDLLVKTNEKVVSRYQQLVSKINDQNEELTAMITLSKELNVPAAIESIELDEKDQAEIRLGVAKVIAHMEG